MYKAGSRCIRLPMYETAGVWGYCYIRLLISVEA